MDLVLRRKLVMAYREFTDSHGKIWRVWSTVPTSAIGLSGGYSRGWLTFDSGDRLRRLAPIPLEWESLSGERLERLCAQAQDVSRRTSAGSRSDQPDDSEQRMS